MPNPKKKFKDTKVGKFLLGKSGIINVIGDILPDQGALGMVKNLIHKERFFTSHQVYEKDHLVHQILGQALAIVEQMSNGSYLYSKCKTINLDFPEVKKIKATSSTFNTLPKNRKIVP